MDERTIIGLVLSWVVSTGLGAILSLPVLLYRVKRLEKADDEIWRKIEEVENTNRSEHRNFRTINEHAECKAGVCTKVDALSRRIDDLRESRS